MTNTDEVEILLVEDNPSDAELALRNLKKHNLANRLEWVKDGEQALDFLFARAAYQGRDMANAPKVVLLDLRLPKVDGVEVLRAMKADARTRMIPVVVLTSSKEDRDIKACYDLGVNSYVAKPVEFAEFSQVISELGLYWLLINKPPV